MSVGLESVTIVYATAVRGRAAGVRGRLAAMTARRTEPVIVRRGTKLPPPAPGIRHVRLPVVPFVIIADDQLRAIVDRRFHWPMLILALLMLPLLAVEFWVRPVEGACLWWASVIGLFVIWLAFFLEFVIKIAIAECRIEYARHNWIDIVIILVPIVRPLRVASIARTSRLFTMRGVGLRLLRALLTLFLGFEITSRFLERLGLRRADGGPDPRTMTRHQLMKEVRQLRRLAHDWEHWHEGHMEHLRERGIDLHEAPPPELLPDEPDDAAPALEDDAPRMPSACESPSPN